MALRIQLPADFRPWRFVCLGCAGVLILVGLRVTVAAAGQGSFAAIAGTALLGIACLLAAAILIAPAVVGVVARPLTGWIGELFYPEETITQPPDDLLRALRQRLRDRYWESATQQLDGLVRAYGHSPELFHLRAHLEAGRTGDYKTVTAAAVAALPSRGFDRYTAMIRRDPPPLAIQTGIDA